MYTRKHLSLALFTTLAVFLAACSGATGTATAVPITTTVTQPGGEATAVPPTPPPATPTDTTDLTVTLDNNGSILTLTPGQRFLLQLDVGYDWTITVSDEAVFGRVVNVLVIKDAQGVYEAHQAGRASLTAVGDPTCLQSKPPCAIPSRLFQIDVIVQSTADATRPVITPYNAANLQAINQTSVQSPYEMLWSPTGDAVLVGDSSGIHTFSSDPHAQAPFIDTGSISHPLSFSQNGLLATLTDNGLIVYNLRDMQAQQTFTDLGPVLTAVLSPDGSKLAVGSDDLVVTLYDAASGQMLTTLSGFTTAAPVYGFSFDPTWQTMIWLSRATVQPMNVASGQLGPRLEHTDFVSALALSPDGSLLATAAAATINEQYTPVIKLWDAQTGAEIATFVPAASAASLAFSPDGTMLAAGNSDGQIVLWDVAGQLSVATLEGHTESVYELAFAADGRFLASANYNQVILWGVVNNP